MNPDFFRSIVFLLLFFLFAVLEYFFPRRKQTEDKKDRWLSNLGMIFFGTLLIKVLLPFSAISAAVHATTNEIGVLNFLVSKDLISLSFSIILGFFVLDLAIYLQHIIFHKVPFFWRFHRIHHLDKNLDVTTGLRFHPVEILLSFVIKASVITLFGINFISVIFFEVVLNATSLFNHSNLNIPIMTDKFLRYVIVTPDMHRIHHSIREEETDSNFGFNFPWWDYFFKTYRDKPEDGQKEMKLGLAYFRSKKYAKLLLLLTLPF